MKTIALLISGILFVAGLYSQNTLTPELLWELDRIGSFEVSAKGDILYTITNYDLKENKGTTQLVVNSKTEQTTIFTGEDEESSFSWSSDGKSIRYIRDNEISEINLSDKKSKSLFTNTDGIGSYKLKGPVLAFTNSVKLDHTTQDQYPDLPEANARIIDNMMYRHWDSWSDFTFNHLYVSKANGDRYGSPIDIMKDEKYNVGAYDISPDGKWVVYDCKKKYGKDFALSTNTDIYLYDVESGTTTNLSEGMMGYDRSPNFSPDGKYLAWESMERDGYESDKNRIMLYEFSTKKKTDLTKNYKETLHGISWSSTGKSIFFISGIQATDQLFTVDINTKTVKQLTKGQHNYRNFSNNSGKLIGERQSISSPSELFNVSIKDGKQEQVTSLNKEVLSEVKMGEVKKRMVKTTDGKEMLTWVVYPPDFDPNKKYPTLLYCQGGPQAAVSQFFSYRWNFQLMAAKGYIVVAPNRRGLPSFGLEWNEQISKDWGGQAIKDYLSAIDDVAKEPYVDTEKLGAVGASYGGYSVYQLAGVHQKRFKTFISHCGLFNLESWYTTTEEMFFANWDIGGAYWTNPHPTSYDKFSPHKYVGNWDTPILVIHGQKDFRVPVTQGMEAFNAAQLQGIQSRFLYFPEEGHWVLEPQNGVLWHREFSGG